MTKERKEPKLPKKYQNKGFNYSQKVLIARALALGIKGKDIASLDYSSNKMQSIIKNYKEKNI